MSLILYHNKMSVCSQKVRIVIAEKGLEVREVNLNLAAGESHSESYLKVNPKGVVPALVDNGRVVTESSVICEYLDDIASDPPLRPTDPYDLACLRLWTLIPDAGLHAWTSTISFAIAWRHQDRSAQIARWSDEVLAHRMPLIELGLSAPQVAKEFGKIINVFNQMGDALSGCAWLNGDKFSLADIALLPYIYRFDDMRLNWIWENNARMSPITAWLDRCRGRKGFDGIMRHHDQTVVADMKHHGAACRSEIERLLRLLVA